MRAFVPGRPRASGKAGTRQLRAADPLSFPELGKADTRSGKDTGSTACESAPVRILVKAREFVRRMQRRRGHLAWPSADDS